MTGQREETPTDEDLKAAAALVYCKPGLDAPLIVRFARQRRLHSTSRCHLVPFARGLTSVVYRIAADDDTAAGSTGDGVDYCLKRVAEEDEMAPHSVEREIQCYQLINDEQQQRRRKGGGSIDVPIASLLAAFRDESDPFSVEIDLIMPFYPCTLEEVMDEPLLHFPSVHFEEDTHARSERPSHLLARQIASQSFASFVHSSTRCLFSALSFLHSCQIAHRDVKPSNILVDPKTLSILLIDFGICYLPSYAPGDDRKGGITSEVGTGAYRAPECLFSPLNGYSADKVDVWQAGVTLIQFLLPLRRVQVTKQKEKVVNDDRQEWEKALWADDDGLSWSQLEASKAAEVEEEEAESSDSGWKRETLFDANRGDLGLANSIFELRGLPSSTSEWPEAEHFQPSLQRMPFPRRPAAPGGLRHRLTRDIPPSLSPIIDILDQCIQLSSSRRLSADDIIKQL